MNELLTAAKDKAAREWGHSSYDEMTDVTIPDDKFITRAMEIYAEMVNGWVSVAEKTPELNQWVLADYGFKVPIIFCYKGDGNWLALDAEIWVTNDGITHWMPLPNKPTKPTKP